MDVILFGKLMDYILQALNAPFPIFFKLIDKITLYNLWQD